MYQRDLQSSKPSPIERGSPIFGTWARAFDDVDLLSIHRPYRLPLPKWMRNYRIKEWQSFQIQDDRYYLVAALTNEKFYRIAHVFLWDKETKEKLIFRKSLPLGSWHLPRSLYNSAVTSRSYGFYFRIHDWLDADIIELDLDVEPTRKRPSFTAHVELDLSRSKASPLVTCLPFSDQRCMYSFKVMAPVRGDMVFGGRHISFNPENASGFVFDYKGFYPYRMRNIWCTGFGFDPSNRSFGFSIAENQAKDTFKNNENGLWFDGRPTALPPVKITMPEGPEGNWIIQDLEGMVDLTFTPREPAHFSFDFLLTRSEYFAPLGYFNGMLLTSEGEKIAVHNLTGFGEQIYLRV